MYESIIRCKYIQTQSYPYELVKEKLTNLLVSFKSELLHVNKQLYTYNQTPTSKYPNSTASPKYTNNSSIYPHLDQLSHNVTLSSIPQQSFLTTVYNL